MKNILRFWCWRFYRSFFSREVLPFYTLFHPPSMDYDVSQHDLVKLFVSIPTSPSSSKTEFGCSSYSRFRIATSASFQRGGDSGPGPETPVRGRRLRPRLRADVQGPLEVAPESGTRRLRPQAGDSGFPTPETPG